jgi:hypothetical protein
MIISTGGAPMTDMLKLLKAASEFVACLKGGKLDDVVNELVSREDALKEQKELSDVAFTEAAKLKQEADAALQEQKDIAADNVKKAQELNDLSNYLAGKQANAKQQEAKLQGAVREIEIRDFALAEKAAKLTDKEIYLNEKLEKVIAEAEATKEEYGKKLEAIKQLAG